MDSDQDNWGNYGLSAPTKVLQAIINESKCFTVVDRGAGFDAAQRERQLAAEGHMRNAHTIGGGQMRLADYVLVPGIILENPYAGGSTMGAQGSGKAGFIGSIMGGASMKSRKQTAEVVLTLTDVRTAEQIISVTDEAKVTDRILAASVSGSYQGNSGQISASNWSNTEIGQVIKDAYKDMIKQIGKRNLLARYGNQDNIAAAPQALIAQTTPVAMTQAAPAAITQSVNHTNEHTQNANIQRAVGTIHTTTHTTTTVITPQSTTMVVSRNVRLLSQPSPGSQTVTELTKDALLYPTGNKNGQMLEVEDEFGHKGWVSVSSMNVR